MSTNALDYLAGQDAHSRALPQSSAELISRREALLSGVVASLHEHPVRLPHPLDSNTWEHHIASARDELATTELRASGLSLVVANCFSVPQMEFVRAWAQSIIGAVDATPGLELALTSADVAFAERESHSSTRILLGLEDLGAIGSSLDALMELADIGISMAGVAYNSGSHLGCGLAQADDTGLTRFGREAVDLMNEFHIIVDVSHAGDRTALETVKKSSKPVVISHAGARSLWNTRRMKSDDVVRAVSESGGLIGITAAPGSTRTDTNRPTHSIDDVIEHIEYCADLVGIESVAIGGDSFYGDHVGLYTATGMRPLAPEGATAYLGERVDGADNPTEIPVQVCAALIERGWADRDIKRILGTNVQRVLQTSLRDLRAH